MSRLCEHAEELVLALRQLIRKARLALLVRRETRRAQPAGEDIERLRHIDGDVVDELGELLETLPEDVDAGEGPADSLRACF